MSLLFYSLREKFREGYSAADFRSDLMAGIVVGLIAIPLGMALAIASGVAPQHGLYTVIIAGAFVALLGGSRCQVSGPTAAFVVILVPVVHQFGLAGLLVAGLMAGILLVLMGLGRLGQLIQYIPHPVTTGFTAGIAVVIATIQIKDFFGLTLEHSPESYFERVQALVSARHTFSPVEFGVAATTLALLLIWPRVNRKIPAPLIALTAVTIGVALLERLSPGLEVASIGSRFGGIPQALPAFTWPWQLPGPDGVPFTLNLATLKALVPSAFAIAILAAIESLLSAVVADGMAQTRHDPDAELVAAGVGNILCPFFGGIAATGAIARTATNIRFGAKSPLAAVIHSIFALLAILVLAPWVGYLPMAALAALLLLVAYNMSDVKHFVHIVKVAPRSDVVVLLLCFILTVVFDMVVGVSVGIVLAALLFMRRMAAITQGTTLRSAAASSRLKAPLPQSVILYEIAGPFFFGAAQSAVSGISAVTDNIRVVIFCMDSVPTMDVTGLVALETAIKKLTAHGRKVILCGVHGQPAELIARAEFARDSKNVMIKENIDEAALLAAGLVSKS